MPSIYDYMDYRGFLKDRFLESKKRNPLFSYQAFSRMAGAKSTSFLKLVIDGKRNISDDGIGMISKGFRLSDTERKYFECLVKFNQAKVHEEKDRYFRELAKNKRFLEAKPLTAAQYRLLSHWYYIAILELARVPSAGPKDAEWFQARIQPRVEIKDVKSAVATLLKLDLLCKDQELGLIRKETMLTTDNEVSALSVANLHAQMSELAARAVTGEPAANREFSALTLVTSEKGFQLAKEEIQKFRKHLHSVLEQDDDGTRDFVSQINLQLFRLSSSETPE